MALIALLLVGMATWAIVGIIKQRNDLRSVAEQEAISDEYRRIVNQATLASYHFLRLRTEGRPSDIDKFERALEAAIAAERRILDRGDDDDRAAFEALHAEYGQLLEDGLRVIGLVRSGQLPPSSLGGEEVFERAVEQLAVLANARRAEAEARYQQVRSEMSRHLLLTLGLYALGLPLVGAVFFAIRRMDNEEVVRRGELARLSEAALTDALTGLGNHRAFQEELSRELSRAVRDNRPLSLAIIDVDDFKEVNDAHGHVRGDMVLAEFARLLGYLRAHDRAFRVGGDEFAVILTETSLDEAVAAMERLRTAVESSLELSTVSIGVACTDQDGFDLDLLKEHADSAMYEAKGAGKNQVATYDSDGGGSITLTTEKTSALRQILDTGSVRTVFQPIYLLGDRHLIAFEALMRPPDDSVISGPVEAFQAAERIGKTWQLDLLCFRAALRSARDLPAGMRLFVNINPRSLANKAFSAFEIAGLVRASGLDTSSIVLEITEQASIPVQLLGERIEELRAAGFSIALDDVGTGNSGLEILRQVSVDYVKIDRSVLVDAVRRGPGRAVLLAITAFAREANAFVIAEGIDSLEMFDLINSDEAQIPDVVIQGIQGFLVGRPMDSLAEAVRTLKRYDIAA